MVMSVAASAAVCRGAISHLYAMSLRDDCCAVSCIRQASHQAAFHHGFPITRFIGRQSACTWPAQEAHFQCSVDPYSARLVGPYLGCLWDLVGWSAGCQS